MCNCEDVTNKETGKLYEMIEMLEEKIDLLIEEMDYINRNIMCNSDSWE